MTAWITAGTIRAHGVDIGEACPEDHYPIEGRLRDGAALDATRATHR